MTEMFITWVKSSEGVALLNLCARQVSSRAKRLEIVLDDAYLELESRTDYLNAVAGGLAAFLLHPDRADRIARKGASLLHSGTDDAFMAFLCREYLDYYIDERREKSPFHAYYRHMREVLSKAEGIRYDPHTRKGSNYAWSSRAVLEQLPDDLSGKDYRGWLDSEVLFRDIYQKPAMLRLSRDFWNESVRQFLKEYLLPIRELIKYAFVKYPMMLTVEYDSGQEDSDNDDEGVTSLENRLVDCAATIAFDDAWKRQLPVLEMDIIDGQLHMLARDCVAELTEQERIILCRLDCEHTLDAIARELGLKGASNVSYHQKKAYGKLHNKWSLWGPPSLKQFAGVDEEEFFMFYEKVITFCKNDKSCRDSRKGTDA